LASAAILLCPIRAETVSVTSLVSTIWALLATGKSADAE
jgi:hypothetical protein